MAITYITGIPRSGKSYYAMYLLYMSFIYKAPPPNAITRFIEKVSPTKKLREYDVAYTNINQFDYTKSEKIKPYDFNEIQSKLIHLHKMYLDKKTDEELIEVAKFNGLYNCLFVIDEAQNFFDKENIVSTWWFTYHGHLHQDIILITQNLDYIFSNYTKIAEFFYKAVPPSSRLITSKFRYIQYNSHKLYQKDKIGDFTVPMIKEIFSLYVSGASNKSKSVVKKYIYISLFLGVITFIAFSFFVSSFFNKAESSQDGKIVQSEQNTTTIQKKPIQQNTIHIPEHAEAPEPRKLFVITCINKLCNYKNSFLLTRRDINKKIQISLLFKLVVVTKL